MKNSMYTFAWAQAAHLPLLGVIEQAAASIFPPGSIPDAIRSESVPLPFLQKAMAQQCLRVALNAQTIPVAFAMLCIEDGLALLAEVDVHPSHGRQGLGRALITQVAQRAVTLGHDTLYLTTFRHIPWNGPYYERLGFQFLDQANTPSCLQELLAEEEARGMEQRVAMALSL